MAEKEELQHLTCSICLEIFSEPKMLPCFHRFCESCLDKYINSCTNNKQMGFPCPCCKQLAGSPNPRKPRSAWAALFKTDFVFKDFISCRLKRPKHPCPAHMDIECDYYCLDCSQILCHRCALASHRRCVDVMTLPEAANQRQALLEAAINRVTTELRGREQSLKHLLAKYNSVIDCKTDRLKADIRTWGEGVRELVKNKEDELLEQLNKKCNDIKQEVESEIMTVQEAADQVQCRIDTARSKLLLSNADVLLDNTVDDAITYCHQVDLANAEENMTRICEKLCNLTVHFPYINTVSVHLANIPESHNCIDTVRSDAVSQTVEQFTDSSVYIYHIDPFGGMGGRQSATLTAFRGETAIKREDLPPLLTDKNRKRKKK